MSKRLAATVDWGKVERLMLQSFTGGRLTESEQRTVEEAFAADPTEYRALHTQVVRAEVERKRRYGA